MIKQDIRFSNSPTERNNLITRLSNLLTCVHNFVSIKPKIKSIGQQGIKNKEEKNQTIVYGGVSPLLQPSSPHPPLTPLTTTIFFSIAPSFKVLPPLPPESGENVKDIKSYSRDDSQSCALQFMLLPPPSSFLGYTNHAQLSNCRETRQTGCPSHNSPHSSSD